MSQRSQGPAGSTADQSVAKDFVQLPRKQVILTMGGVTLALFLSALDQTVVSTAMPRVIADLGGFGQVHLGDHVLSRGVHHGGADHRKADRHLWPEAVLHRGHPRVHAGVDPRRNEPDDEPANRLPGSPGHWRRGDHGQQLRGHSGPVPT